MSLQGISLHRKKPKVPGMFLKVGKFAEPVVQKPGHAIFFRCIKGDARYGHKLQKKMVYGMRLQRADHRSPP